MNNKFFKMASLIILIFSFNFYCLRSYNLYKYEKTRFFDKFSTTYINKVVQEVNKIDNKWGLKIESYDEMHKFNETENFLGYFLYASNNNVNLNSLTLLDMYYDKSYKRNNQAEMFLEKSPLVNYVKSNFEFYESKNKCLVINDIIDNYNYNFVFVSNNNELPLFLENRVEKKIVDNKSGEKFYLFK